MLGAMNPMNLMPFGSEKEEKDADDQKACRILQHPAAFKRCADLVDTSYNQLPAVGCFWQDPEVKMQKQLSYIEKDYPLPPCNVQSHICQEICNMNCKMAGLMGAAAGGAAGHVVEKKLKEKSEATTAIG